MHVVACYSVFILVVNRSFYHKNLIFKLTFRKDDLTGWLTDLAKKVVITSQNCFFFNLKKMHIVACYSFYNLVANRNFYHKNPIFDLSFSKFAQIE